MLKFDKEGMADMKLLTKEEALVFGLFLYSEMLRHQMDIDAIIKKMSLFNKKYGFDIEQEYKRRFI